MLINYVPGEECRVAVVEDGKLEEFHAERAASISRVGNIYVGRVTNVEPAIQAAFVDFGIEHHGFLHVTDIHPRYFPGEDDETTERVGKKTPRRERPPIQKCFRRGDEVLVQVLKEGVGTKGPTLTSYLSIPGRFLVMMPQMDKVGVSRKVEDEDQRKAMRAILDQLELPEGFGFILRTAGMDRTKAELKRDLAYLARLWKDMESRRTVGSKPRLLYSESDLLVRALRDILAPEITEVVIDNELALARASRFLKIVAPRSKVRLLQFEGRTPLFHAFGIEQQIAMMHAREVPLPSGGRLVIDETEALVAIDVNSGRMRDARDAETNAYRTNCEAVEEICRQLKLRDLGGIVINDLIDMRQASHRKDIEQRMRDRLKRDRARTTVLNLSAFGILEMTRQRMRGSHESVHFVDCPTCRGRGMVQKPDSVAADGLRNLAAMLDHENVARVEMVVSPRVASELLSGRRKSLNKLERSSGKHVDVRVSETVAVDRISFYAYDAAGADIDVESLPAHRPPSADKMKVWELPASTAAEEEAWASDIKDAPVEVEPDLTPSEQAELEDLPSHPIEFDEGDDVSFAPAADGQQQPQGEQQAGGRRRRRGRRGRGGRGGEGQPGGQGQAQGPGQGQAQGHAQAGGRGQGNGNGQPQQGGRQEPQRPREGTPQRPPIHPQPQPAAISPDGHGEFGPSGQPPMNGDVAQNGDTPGGRRRRRRRRRGRGGEGQQGTPMLEGGPDHEGASRDSEPRRQPHDEQDPFAPRGDSWDLTPEELARLRPPAPEPRSPKPRPTPEPIGAPGDDEPGHVEPEPVVPAELTDEEGQTDEAAEAELIGAGGPPSGEPGEQGEGGRRRRRRRRRRGRGGKGGQGGEAGQGEAGPGEGGQGGQGGEAQGGHGDGRPQRNAQSPAPQNPNPRAS
jgi:ribonuclease E